ncbi:heterokaryon incompatibility protein [Pyrenochaeta sp. DS3sAY3a]|nr:heterokaryon incompatibility protein [Pyrenochaeta sp. DS3sAY3a]
MTTVSSNFSTTYVYTPLQTHRHIRVLEIVDSEPNLETSPSLIYSLVQFELSSDDVPLDFEAISYTWGDPVRVSGLHIQGQNTHIGLTANLTEALPHLAKHSKTKRLWIDQLCVNQADNAEKAIQIGLMSEIYKRAARVIIWLGPEDESSRMCRQWLEAIDALIPTLKSANKITIGSPEYLPEWRLLVLRDTFSSPDTDPCWAAAIGKFWGRMWFRRGWIVQEFLLPSEILCLTGDVRFSLQDMVDLFNVPADDALAAATGGSLGYRILMQLKTDAFLDTPQPLRFLRVMASVAEEFETKELADRLYGFLGLIDGLDFVPDYETSVKANNTRFAATLARQYGSLDFLSMWSANLDMILKNTPEELRGLPSWVPSFSATPLTAPWRLAIAGARSWGSNVRWNAAAGRRHKHDQPEDAATTRRLYVRGKIIDHIDCLSSARIAKFYDIDEAYLTSIVDQIKKDLAGFDHWTQIELVDFLNTVSYNGNEPRETAAQILDIAPSILTDEHRPFLKHVQSLAICLTMARGRKIMTTEMGRKGLAPYIDSVARQEEEKGSAIVVLHGCIVPIVLQRVDESGEDGDQAEWKVVGDCYVEGVMHGEIVKWNEDDTQTFVLV